MMNQNEQHAVSLLIKERDELRAALATARAGESAWRDFAEHQEHCAVCGESVEDCEDGSRLKRTATGAIKDDPAQGEG